MTYSSTITIRLSPGAASDRIGDMRLLADGTEALVVYVTAPPDKNKANEAMIRLLAKHLAVPPSHLTLLRGHTNRTKVVGIK